MKLLLYTLVPFAGLFHASAQTVKTPDYDAFRMGRQHDLGRADGLLSLQRSYGFHPGTYSVGSMDGSQLMEIHLAPRAGDLVVDEAGNATFVVAGQPPAKLPVQKTNDLHLSTDEGWVHSGPVSFAMAPLKGGVHILVKDREAPAVLSYPGLRWFPVSSNWRITAKWTPYATEHPLEIAMKNGQIVKEPAIGFAQFQIAGQPYRLDAVDDDGDLFFVVGDKTNGSTSYGAGRFLEHVKASNGMHEAGVVVLDFNLLVNPYCAYSPYQNCPRPTKANTLPLEVKAGEEPFPGDAKE